MATIEFKAGDRFEVSELISGGIAIFKNGSLVGYVDKENAPNAIAALSAANAHSAYAKAGEILGSGESKAERIKRDWCDITV